MTRSWSATSNLPLLEIDSTGTLLVPIDPPPAPIVTPPVPLTNTVFPRIDCAVKLPAVTFSVPLPDTGPLTVVTPPNWLNPPPAGLLIVSDPAVDPPPFRVTLLSICAARATFSVPPVIVSRSFVNSRRMFCDPVPAPRVTSTSAAGRSSATVSLTPGSRAPPGPATPEFQLVNVVHELPTSLVHR